MTSSSPRLAAADRKLLRDVFAWGHTSGWTYTRTGRDYTFDHPEAGTVEASDGLRRINAYYWRDLGQHHVSFWPESATEAVDVLVALGILPARFSSAFTAGRESVYDLIEYRVMAPTLAAPRSSSVSVISAFQDLGWYRRNGYPEAWLECRYTKEPSDWKRVPDAN